MTAFEGLDADGTIIPSEFDQTSESEVETESETEVEAEAAPGAAGAAVATGATAAAAGSNALTQTLSSGSISVKGVGETAGDIEDPQPTGNTDSIIPGSTITAFSNSTP